jgi:hypothetical protein
LNLPGNFRTLLILHFSLFFFVLNAQDIATRLQKNTIYPGCVISMTGDTTKGFLLFKSLTRSQVEVTFYDSLGGQPDVWIFKPGEINGYILSGLSYRTVPYSGRYSSRKSTFMQCLVDGTISLYTWYYDEKQRYFEDNAFWEYTTTYNTTELFQEYYLFRAGVKPLRITDCASEYKFPEKLSNFLSDQDTLAQKIKAKLPGYRCQDMIKIIHEFNSSLSKSSSPDQPTD